MIDFINGDCMEYMRQMPDKTFDLAIVDPPYGDANGGGVVSRQADSRSCKRTGGTWASKFGKKIIAWDVAPGKEYFEELFRISRNQIIWGGQLL